MDARDCAPWKSSFQQVEAVAHAYLALVEQTTAPARVAGAAQVIGQCRRGTGHVLAPSGAGHLEDRGTDFKDVTYADVMLVEAPDGEVLSEGPRRESLTRHRLPVRVATPPAHAHCRLRFPKATSFAIVRAGEVGWPPQMRRLDWLPLRREL